MQIANLGNLGLSLRGDYSPTESYKRNEVVRSRNSIWGAMRDILPNEEPGISPAWMLIIAGDDVGAGLPLLATIWSLTGLPEDGFLDMSVNNGPLSRAAFREAADKIQRAYDAGKPTVVDDATWLAQVAAHGVCPKFSLGNGSTTFRIPLIRKRISFAAPDEAAGALPGMYLPDQMRVITGETNRQSSDGIGLAPTGAYKTGRSRVVYSDVGSTATAACLEEDSSRLGPRYSGDITHGPLVIATPLIKMYGAVTNAGDLDMAAFVQSVAGKLDASAVPPSGIAPKPTTTDGVGKFVQLVGSASTVSLPAGGTWVYSIAWSNNSGASSAAYTISGIAAGGTTYTNPGYTGAQYGGWAWRIA